MRKDRVSLPKDKWQHAISSLSHKSSLDLFICVRVYVCVFVRGRVVLRLPCPRTRIPLKDENTSCYPLKFP